jgi:hypothetical protein
MSVVIVIPVPEATGAPEESLTWIVTMLVPEQETLPGEALTVTVKGGPGA